MEYTNTDGTEAENIDYLELSKTVTDDNIKILQKIIKKLDLEYLLNPEQLLAHGENLQRN